MEMLRRFQSEPVLANPRLESGNFKIKSDLRQSILYRHKQLTPMSDKRHPIRSSNPVHKQPLAGEKFLLSCSFRYFHFIFLVPTIPLLSFSSPSAQITPPEQLWLNYPRSVYGCYSTGKISYRISIDCIRSFVSVGNLGENGGPPNHLTTAPEAHHLHTNILGPKHFIVEEENEALLAKELQEAKIHSTHNSLSSMHGSQAHFNLETHDFCLRNPSVRSRLHFNIVFSMKTCRFFLLAVIS